jgi:uncharacterized protein (DUF849 family)
MIMNIDLSPSSPTTIGIHAALNGDRDHPAAPRSFHALASDAAAAVAAGARSVHLHPYDDQGRQTLDAHSCAATLAAVRRACPGTPVSLSTSATIEPDPQRRLTLIDAWVELPDLVTANQGEEGIVELCDLLLGRGVGIEAGLLSIDDARAFIRARIASRCTRALIEPLDADPHEAVQHAAAMEEALAEAGVSIEQVHHGDGFASWAVNRRAASRGHDIRTGLEDTPVLPDGRLARNNEELILAASQLLQELD